MKAKQSKAQYTIEFKQEAIRLVKSGQPAMQVASTLGMPHQTLDNWLRADKLGKRCVAARVWFAGLTGGLKPGSLQVCLGEHKHKLVAAAGV